MGIKSHFLQDLPKERGHRSRSLGGPASVKAFSEALKQYLGSAGTFLKFILMQSISFLALKRR